MDIIIIISFNFHDIVAGEVGACIKLGVSCIKLFFYLKRKLKNITRAEYLIRHLTRLMGEFEFKLA